MERGRAEQLAEPCAFRSSPRRGRGRRRKVPRHFADRILSERPDQNQLVLRAHPANERDPVARDAGLGDTASMLQHLFEDEERDSGIRWRISPFPGLGSSRARDASVSYVGTEEVNGISGYCFEYEGLIPDAPSLYLRPEQDMGTDKQIRRRQRNIETLNSRADVLRMLEDPWRERRTLRAPLSDAVVLEDLDQTKQVAIGALWTTAPAFWVVGPPGVGKTKLATAAVHAIFRNDPAARILICAQGHDALDNLEEKIAKLKGNELSSDLVIVRSNAADRESALRVERVSGDLLRDFLSSNLVQSAPPGLRGRSQSWRKAPRPARERLACRTLPWNLPISLSPP